MKSFITTCYMNNEKDSNYEVLDEAIEAFGKDAEELHDLLYFGYEVKFQIEFFEDLTHKVLKINDIDVSEKGLSL